MKILEAGIHLDVPPSDYFADPCVEPSLTQSVAKILIERSPAHARLEHPKLCPPVTDDDEPEKYVAAQAIGNAAHALMIGRGRDIAEGEFDNWMSKAAKDFKKDMTADGKIVILSKHLVRAKELVKQASYQLDAAGHRDAFRVGNGEVVLVWQEDGMWFRSMVDWMVDTTRLYDLKTSGMSCAPHGLGRMVEAAGWHVQAAFHERGLDILDPDNAGRREFHFIAVENAPPYALVPVLFDEYWMTMGRKKVARAVALWRQCIETDIWPSYPVKTITPEYPVFAEKNWLNREITEWADHPEYQKVRAEIRRARQPVLDSLMGG